jgi:hypothetical protein
LRVDSFDTQKNLLGARERSRRGDLRSKFGDISSFMAGCFANFDQVHARAPETLICDGEQVFKSVWLIAPDHDWAQNPSRAERQSFLLGVMLEFDREVRALVRNRSYDQMVFQKMAQSGQVDPQTF